MAAVMVTDEADGIVETGQPLGLIEMPRRLAIGADVRNPTHVARTKIGPQAHLAGDGGNARELVIAFGPGAIQHRGDRHRRGDAVADQLREGIAVLEQLLVRRIGLDRAGLQIGLGPHPANLVAGTVVEAQDRGVEIAQRIEIGEARANDGIAIVDAALHMALETMAYEDNGVALEHHLALLDDDMAAAIEANDVTA